MARTTDERDPRRDAKHALREAKRAEKQSAKLAKTLQGDARTRLQQLTTESHVARKAAKQELARDPRRAGRLARRASRRLERAAILLTAGGRTARKEKAASVGTPDAKMIKRRRDQAKKARSMAKKIALGTVVRSVVTPSDDRAREKATDRRRRARKDPALGRAKATAGKGR